MERKEFDKLVEEALAYLPDDFREKMENVAVFVQDYPTGDMLKKFGRDGLLGVFIGVPLTAQSWEGGYHPHRIILYQKNIEAHSRDDYEIKEHIFTTVIHEVGHYFGIGEKRIRELQGLPPEPRRRAK
jgi:predicted Zn-dependent protease with MMP-like domain